MLLQLLPSKPNRVAGVEKVLLAESRLNLEKPCLKKRHLWWCLWQVLRAHIAATATAFGKNLLPRVAALLDASQVSDVTEITMRKPFPPDLCRQCGLKPSQTAETKLVLTIRAIAFVCGCCDWWRQCRG